MVKIEEFNEGGVPGLYLPVEVKEEVESDLDDHPGVGEAMAEFLRRRGEQAGPSLEGGFIPGVGGFIPGIHSLPFGRIPELLGFSEEEIREMFPNRALGVSVPYLGEASGLRRECREGVPGPARVPAIPRRRGGVPGPARAPANPRRSGRLNRRGDRRMSSRSRFTSGRCIRPISNINRESRNRPLQMACRAVDPPLVSSKPFRPIPQSYHHTKWNESREPFSKTGLYHPGDGRIRREGIWDAVVEDLELYKIPPVWWPESLSYSDYYSSSSEHSDSPGKRCFACIIVGLVAGWFG